MVQSTALHAGVGVARRKSTQRPIDMEHLAEQALGDDGLALEVLRLFDSSIRSQFGRLETSTTIPSLLQHLHTIRGAASGVGAWALRDLAKLAEDELRAGGAVNPERVEDIGMAVQEVSAFIAELVAQQPE